MADSATKQRTLLEAAQEALSQGLSVFPVQVSGAFAKKPHYVLVDTGHAKEEGGKVKPSWKPLQTVLPTDEHLRTWYSREHGKGLAVVTGAVSRLIVLDFDGEDGERLREQLNLPAHVRTGSGGAHVYFQHPGWAVPTLNSKAKKELGARWPGLDIRADGGYAVMPPSVNAKGPYTWVQDALPAPMPLDVLPRDLREFLGLLAPPQSAQVAPVSVRPNYQGRGQDEGGRVSPDLLISRALEQVGGGEGRNNAGAWLATQLRDNGYSEGEAVNHLLTYVAHVPAHDTHGVHDPYTMQEARQTLRSIFSRPAREPWTPRSAAPAYEASSKKSSPPAPAIAEGGTSAVVLVPESATELLKGAGTSIENLTVVSRLTAEELKVLVRDERPVYAVAPTVGIERLLDASGVEWHSLPPLNLKQSAAALVEQLQSEMTDAYERIVSGNLNFLRDILPEMADARLQRGGNTYPTGLSEFDEAIGGGFYDGLHVLGGVTGGGKTALSLASAESNARAGRPVLYVTYEQSQYELWSRIVSVKTGIPLRDLRTGGTAADPVQKRLQKSPAYRELREDVAPYLTVIEGDGMEGGSWNVDRIAAHVKRLKAHHQIAPLVILDYLQRMPSGDQSDKRHQIDDIVMGLQVRLGRGLNTPILLISSVGRGSYGELLNAPLEDRLSVFKESGGVEYTAYTASLMYPLSADNMLLHGLEAPPVAGSGRAALHGRWRYVVLDLVKNREGEAPRQWVLKWYPASGRFEAIDSMKLPSLGNIERGGKRRGSQ